VATTKTGAPGERRVSSAKKGAEPQKRSARSSKSAPLPPPAAPVRLRLNDPNVLWHVAIERWIEGDGSKLRLLLVGDGPIPAFARAWLADALENKVQRRTGPKRRKLTVADGLRHGQIHGTFDVKLALEQLRRSVGGTPSERAIAATAIELNMTEDQVRSVVYPRKSRRQFQEK
jgi:hypothetical protein